MTKIEDRLNVFDVTGLKGDKRVKGIKVGIELEYEANRLPSEGDTHSKTSWLKVHDGSLREPCGEFVLKSPRTMEKAYRDLDELFGLFKSCRTDISESVRAGVHVHLNVQDLTMTQLYNLFTLYLVFEEPLVAWCGDNRVGNLFCLRASDAGALTYELAEATGALNFKRAFFTDNLRYASMNVKSLHTYGSLEFRCMQSTDDIDRLKTWVGMLVQLRKAAEQYNNPTEIIRDFSLQGGVEVMRTVFGKEYTKELTVSGRIEESLFTGMRNAQEVAFSTDWDKFEDRILAKYVGKQIRNNYHDAEVVGEWHVEAEPVPPQAPIPIPAPAAGKAFDWKRLIPAED